ncbi:hypothetical protein P4V86_22100 [Brevibacillus laterosporus]|uniref:hypothetical protein n=1 Tax=Brevibacillus laterosporus TaxID=1465 RepID=UPI0003817BC9|nr:hypothetical protein [Brevibacillus laterosporus]ATO48266.1 hypothetical protein BrL25_03585 [Brevibacillus laterosporus DSM 25]MBG9804342.1 hypothetical protein [Brevibacillus laterosporus]MED2006025.1 hypothetical protein [Brevibacillus laterosporus]MED4764566.1 hypothetical protein [Brevibacillus laterosporus]TPH12664.1 hypothetical protein EGH09_16105 [Brevibacillus laterosporus]
MSNDMVVELLSVQKEMFKVRQGMMAWKRDSVSLQVAWRQMGRDFLREADRMERRIKEVRSQLQQLGTSVQAKLRVEIDDQATQKISQMRSQFSQPVVVSGGGDDGGSANPFVDLRGQAMRWYKNSIPESQSAAKERGLFIARGKTDAEVQDLDRSVEKMLQINPNVSKTEAISIYNRSDEVNSKDKAAYAEFAAKLSMSTGFSADQSLKMMALLRDSTGVSDPERLANSLQYMSTNMKDFSDDFVSSMIKYTSQLGMVMDTPEKMAMLVGEIGNMGIASNDMPLGALKDIALKMSTQGDLSSVLQKGYEADGKSPEEAKRLADSEAIQVTQLLHSDNKSDNQTAMGRIFMNLASIKDDNVRQEMLNAVGSGSGKELLQHLVPLLEKTGKISAGEVENKVANNEVNKSYKAAIDQNPWFEYMKAQSEAKAAMVDLTATVAKDLTPVIKMLTGALSTGIQIFNQLPAGIRYTLEGLGVYLLAKWAKENDQGDGGGDGPDNKQDKCCCTDGSDTGGEKRDKRKGSKKKRGGKKGKRKLGPSKFGGKNTGGASKSPKNNPSNPSNQKKPTKPKTQPKPAKPLSRKATLPTTAPKKAGKPATGFGKLKDIGGKAFEGIKSFGGAAWDGLKNLGGKGFGGVKSFGKGLLKKIPFVGEAMDLASLATSDNKPMELLKLGGSAGMKAAGTMIGATVGSIVPGLGTAVGGVVGGFLGSVGGDFLMEKLPDWFGWGKEKQETPPAPVPPAQPSIPISDDASQIKSMRRKPQDTLAITPAPPVKPVATNAADKKESAQNLSVTVSTMPITLHADGVLQDVVGMIRLLKDPTVTNEIKRIIETAFVNALETRGGKA